MDLVGCIGLKSLYGCMVVDGYLDLKDNSITSLPDSLSVGESMFLNRCIELRSLPKKLSVRGSLYLNNCTGIRSFPEDMYVGRYLSLSGCKLYQFDLRSITVGEDVCGAYEIIPNSMRFINE